MGAARRPLESLALTRLGLVELGGEEAELEQEASTSLTALRSPSLQAEHSSPRRELPSSAWGPPPPEGAPPWGDEEDIWGVAQSPEEVVFTSLLRPATFGLFRSLSSSLFLIAC